ncbi:MAG TPA: glycosyltransferase [Desulfosalsimonadaceae bacterium]|nr:glycosyltransferase [Desulfosalsimonadaceae bacterium]
MAEPIEKRLRVLFISDAIASRNGVGSYYADLVDHLADYIDHAELLSPGTEPEDYAHELTFPLPGDPTQRLYLPKVTWIWQRIKAVCPDVIVIPTPGPYGLAGFAMARYLGIPLCAGYHTQYDKLTDIYWTSVLSGFSRFYMKSLNRVLFRFSAVVVGNSGEMIAGARADGAENAEMIGTPAARHFLAPPFAPMSSKFASVCYAGRLALEKNIRDILEAARRLPHIRFIIAGDGPLRAEVEKMADTVPNIEYVGWVSRDGVKQVIDSAEMLLLPSKVEAFGTIALEAMARRRLVLVSENCGILNWPDLAPGVYAMAPDEDLFDAISRISRKSLSERLEKAEIAHQAAAAFNRQTMRQWVDLFAHIAEPTWQ